MIWLYVGLGAMALVFLNGRKSSAPPTGIDSLGPSLPSGVSLTKPSAPAGAPPAVKSGIRFGPAQVPLPESPSGSSVVSVRNGVVGVYTPTVQARTGRGAF